MSDLDNSIIIKYLQEQGFRVASTEYYTFIKEWEDWFANEVDFHKYKDQTGVERKMYRLGMAKRVAEDWASIILSEEDEIKAIVKSKKQTDKNNKYIEKIMEELNLYTELQDALERTAATGTVGAVFRINNVTVKDNVIIANPNTKRNIIFLTARQIIPLTVEHGKIIEVAFVSESTIKNKTEYYIEIHQKKWNPKINIEEYVITNTYLDEQGKEIEKKGIPKEYTFHSEIPLFSICKTPIANPKSIRYKTNGLGYSVYGDAIDQLKTCDTTYNNFAMDFYLGGKKVFYNKKIVKMETIQIKKEDGSIIEKTIPVYPDDVTRQQWATYGDEMENVDDEPAVIEYNPDLRVGDNTAGVQFALDVLSFKVGFGTKYYQFNANGTVTATQYSGERQDLVKNAKKFRRNASSFIKSIFKTALFLGRVLFGEAVTEDCDIAIVDQDGFLVDTETAKEEFRKDIAQGIRQAWEYRVKFLGEDEETAKKMVEGEDIEDIEEEEEDKNEKDSKISNKNKKQQKKDEEEE